MNEADILATTYEHTCTILRQADKKDANGWDVYEKTPVYERIPCAVSFSGMPTSGETDTVQRIDYIATLFTRPEIEIEAGDEVIADIYGHRYEFITNEPIRYVSHLQVPLIRGDMA